MNPNLSKFLDYLRSNHDATWSYNLGSPLDKLSVVFPDKFRWNQAWETFDIIEPLGQGVSPSDYIAKFFGMSVSKYLDIFAFMDEGTSQDQFIAALEKYSKSKE